MKPFCFILMPFGIKADENGRQIDFDCVYKEVIRPAIEDAGLEPIRADEETTGGIIHKAMFERLMLCDFAVADLTTTNPNVLYELGIRHGARPHTTVLIFAKQTRLPFDVAPLRGLPYGLGPAGRPESPAADRAALAERLRAVREPSDDSPLFQLVSAWPRPDIARLKTDEFRQVVEYSRKYKDKLRAARERGPEAVAQVEAELNVRDDDPAIVVDLLLSYRAVGAWQAMVDLVPRMSKVLAQTVLVREQLGFALNRLKRRVDAEATLRELIAEHGPSSETNGLLGRVYKDLWEDTGAAGQSLTATGYLRKAVETYLAGFESDWRDAYPGINAVTLMEQMNPVDPRQSELLPVVLYAVRRRLASKTPDYWDHATVLELAVLRRDEVAAAEAASDALAAVREYWEPESTARNLSLIRSARERRGESAQWIEGIEAALAAKAKDLKERS
jgi:tetratricopeptide (TPR) repeat protein